MEWITVQQYAKRKNVSERTVYRLIKRGEVHAEKVGAHWRLSLLEADHLDQAGSGHQDYISGQLIDVRMELARLSTHFPTVWDGYRADASNRLKWIGENDNGRIAWRLSVEEGPGWKFVLQHLQSGLSHAFKALQRVKESYARYCQELVTLEDRLRKDTDKIIKDDPGFLIVNESHFFRSILSILDQQSSTLGEEAHLTAPVEGGIEVSYSGVWLLTAFNQDKAQEWISRHTDWRRQVEKLHKGRINQLRRDIKAGIDVLGKTMDDMEARGWVPGTCDYCPTRPREIEC